MGLRAELLPHQLANVRRILTAPEVRHLLADEVGLGKTVQALQVVNALRLDWPELRALVIVPDRLVPQWRDEIMTRAHVAPIEAAPGPGDLRRVRLAWPATLQLADVSPEAYDLLIVDELHELTTALQDKIVAAAPAFTHLLLLTATPAFRDSRRHAQLFEALEPVRTDLARRSIVASEAGRRAALADEPQLSKWPRWALADLVAGLHARDDLVAELLERAGGDWSTWGGQPPAEDRDLSAALAHCVYRRVIRTRRRDYPGILPARVYERITVEPTHGEAERERLMWAYFSHLAELSREFDPVKLAKRVILSAPSLRQRVAFLRRRGHERDGLLERVSPLLSDDHGDARLDALTDLLASIWREDPAERVLVAAQDNLTVDYLFKAIPARLREIGPRGARVPLVPRRVRQGMDTDAAEDLAAYGNETNENLEAFQFGEAQLLFAPDAAQVGLNLQCARFLILYSVPWSPEEVEQWIGRLDRIGNTAVRVVAGRTLPVRVYTIVERGLVDEKVVAVLERFRVFERNINLDGEHLREMAESIEAAALPPHDLDWSSLEESVAAMADEDDGQELPSALRGLMPWGVEDAKRLREWIDSLPPLAGALRVDGSARGPGSWDRAVDGWTWLLARAKEYSFRVRQVEPDNPHSRFSTLWYKYGGRNAWGRGREILSQVDLSEAIGGDPHRDRHPRNAAAFFTRRAELHQPARREVTMALDDEEYRRPLHFLNHGDPLHDELMQAWLEIGRRAPSRLEVRLPPDHEALQRAGEGIFVVRVVSADPTSCLPDVDDRALIDSVGASATRARAERLPSLLAAPVARLNAELRADGRWIRDQLPLAFDISVAFHEEGGWRPAPEGFVDAILNPYATTTELHPVSRSWEPDERTSVRIASGLEEIAQRQQETVRDRWSSRLPKLQRQSRVREYVLSIDADEEDARHEDLIAAARARLAVVESEGNALGARRARAALDDLEDLRAVARAVSLARRGWLRDAIVRARTPQVDVHLEIALRVLAHGR